MLVARDGSRSCGSTTTRVVVIDQNLGHRKYAGTPRRLVPRDLAEGAVSAESWQALPYDDFLNLLEEVEP